MIDTISRMRHSIPITLGKYPMPVPKYSFLHSGICLNTTHDPGQVLK